MGMVVVVVGGGEGLQLNKAAWTHLHLAWNELEKSQIW